MFEQIDAEFFEFRSSNGAVKIDVLSKGVNFNGCLSSRRENSFCSFTLSSQSSDRPRIVSDIDLMLLLEFSTAILHKSIVEILSSQMSISSSSFHFEYPFVDIEQTDIKCSSSKVKDKHITIRKPFLVKSIGNCSCCWLINYPENVQSSNRTSILSSLSLRVIEVSWDCDDCIFHWLCEVGFRDFLHFR